MKMDAGYLSKAAVWSAGLASSLSKDLERHGGSNMTPVLTQLRDTPDVFCAGHGDADYAQFAADLSSALKAVPRTDDEYVYLPGCLATIQKFSAMTEKMTYATMLGPAAGAAVVMTQ